MPQGMSDLTAFGAGPIVDGRARPSGGHALWLRICHWISALAVLTLATSGFIILMAHPRLYWGQVGNDLTPPLIELPISRNYKHGGWAPSTAFAPGAGAAVTAVRTYDIFNQNGWARSLHFLAAWFLLAAGAFYLFRGLLGGHLWRDLIPRVRELSLQHLREDLQNHRLARLKPATGGPPYGLLQKLTYCAVVFVMLPMMLLTGLTMAPAITAAYPGLLDFFGGNQTARTLHFCFFAALVLFIVVHVAMVVVSGFRVQMRAMIRGK